MEAEIKLKILAFWFLVLLLVLLMLAYYLVFATIGECVSDLDVRKEIAVKETSRITNRMYLMPLRGKSLLKLK